MVPITPTPASSSKCTTTLESTSYTTLTVTVSPTTPAVSSTSSKPLPIPSVSTFPSTGVFTIPATTLTITESTTVCAPTTTPVTSGTNTIGGVTTIVETETTIVCPYATVKPTGTTVTSIIEMTTYVCPSAGTYTIAPITTYVPTSTVMVYPTPATVTPGTYTQPEQVVTITETDYTYYCPFATSAPTTTSVAPVVVSTTSAMTSATSGTSATNTGAVALAKGGSQWGMTYSPYTNAGGCKDKASVINDINNIKAKGFSVVRIYSTDCNGLQWVGEAAASNGLKLILGVYISNTGISPAQEQVDTIAAWGMWELVELIVVGNEAIQSGYVDASTLTSFIGSSKATFRNSGYTGPVTTTEPLDIWQEVGSAMCGVIDVVGCNIHPFFNAQTTAAEAGKFVQEEFTALSKVCPGKDMFNLETGWPSAGNANGAAVPGSSEQVTAIQTIVELAGAKSVFFSYSNDKWKQPGPFDVEQYWGCADLF